MTTTISKKPLKKEETTTKSATNVTERNDLNGLILKQPKSDKIFLIDLGKRRPISRETLSKLFKNELKIYEYLDIALIRKWNSIPEEAYLFRAKNNEKVFLHDIIRSGTPSPRPVEVKRHVVNPRVMDRYEFDWDKIKHLDLELDDIKWPDGPPITNPPEL